jgi:hypothetical protein
LSWWTSLWLGFFRTFFNEVEGLSCI